MTRSTRLPALLLAAMLTLNACQHPGQNRYGYQDVGKATTVEFGTVLAVRQVEITGKNNNVGATVGAAGGAVAGAQIGHGDGSLAGALAGALIAGLIGHAVEQSIVDRKGVEYTITLASGRTMTVAQNLVEGEAVLPIGSRAMVQTSGEYMRVLPADALPEAVEQPKGVKVKKKGKSRKKAPVAEEYGPLMPPAAQQ